MSTSTASAPIFYTLDEIDVEYFDALVSGGDAPAEALSRVAHHWFARASRDAAPAETAEFLQVERTVVCVECGTRQRSTVDVEVETRIGEYQCEHCGTANGIKVRVKADEWA